MDPPRTIRNRTYGGSVGDRSSETRLFFIGLSTDIRDGNQTRSPSRPPRIRLWPSRSGLLWRSGKLVSQNLLGVCGTVRIAGPACYRNYFNPGTEMA